MKRRIFPIGFLLVAVVLTIGGCVPTSPETVPPPTVAPTDVPEGDVAGMPNPASVYCEEQGYTLEIRTDESGGQYGVCVFPDGSECEEWAFFRGECGPGSTPSVEPGEPDTVQFDGDGVQFSYAASLATGVTPQQIPADEVEDAPEWAVAPAYRQFLFEGYVLPQTFHEPRLIVYPAVDFEALNPIAARVIPDLRQLLEQRPAEIDELPFLPPFNAAQMMHAQVEYVDFQNGSGVRFLTQYAQAYLPINNSDLFYTYQGLSDDGEVYVAALLPVSHPSLPAHSGEIPEGDFDAFAENFETYIAGIQDQLDAEDPSSFTPDLSLLDQMIQSLQVDPSVVAGGEAGTSAPTAGELQPLDPEECAALQALVNDELDAEATLGEVSFVDPASGESGSGCEVKVEGTGVNFGDVWTVAEDLKSMLVAEGWEEDVLCQADGPTGTASGLRRDGKLCMVSVMWTPAEEAGCPTDQPISACDVPPEQQLFTISLACAQDGS